MLKIERNVVLSYKISIEKILENLKKDISWMMDNRNYGTDRIYINIKIKA